MGGSSTRIGPIPPCMFEKRGQGWSGTRCGSRHARCAAGLALLPPPPLRLRPFPALGGLRPVAHPSIRYVGRRCRPVEPAVPSVEQGVPRQSQWPKKAIFYIFTCMLIKKH